MIYSLDDIEADFRTFYGLTPEDAAKMTGPHFLSLVWRLGAYQGVLAARMSESEDSITRTEGVVEATPTAIQSNPILSDLIDYG